MNNILFIIQARMGSTRLPGKVLRPLGSDRLLDILVHCVRKSAFYQKDRDNLVIATSDKETDDILEEHCIKHGYRVFRGSEERVLDRFVKVIEAVKPSVIIRLTGDNPFVASELLAIKALYQKAGERPNVSASELISILNRNSDAAIKREAD